MAKYIYTCFECGFPFAMDESEMPSNCPGCGASSEHFLKEPWTGSIETRRIHVDPPAADPNRDPHDISFHTAKDFHPQNGHGMIRRWVMGYDDPLVSKKFYEECLGWDIVKTEHSDAENPLMYCATGPGTEDWQPNVPSFTYGYLKKKDMKGIEPTPSYIIQVDSIEKTARQVPELGGEVICENLVVEGERYAVLKDSEGNLFYIWEIPSGSKVPTAGVNPGRPPKKFPKKDLHGRTRFLLFSYKDFRRWQNFYMTLFGWDMIETPEAASGIPVGSDHPCLVCQSGPAQPDYEATECGYLGAMVWCSVKDGVEKPGLCTEVHMDVPIEETIRMFEEHGGHLVTDKKLSFWANSPKDGAQSWIITAVIEDPAGNYLYLWKCPSSRTWEEPETGYDGPDGIIYG